MFTKKIKISFIIILLVIISACNTNKNLFLIGAEGMRPTLNINDMVRIDKSDNTFNYGDIIACYQKFPYRNDEIIVISRIVALPQDSIYVKYDFCVINNKENKHSLLRQKAMINEVGRIFDEFEEVFPNGKKIKIFHSPDFDREEDITKSMKIPSDHFFIMGDNRSDSDDSRYLGPVHKDKIIGKVVEIIPAE